MLPGRSLLLGGVNLHPNGFRFLCCVPKGGKHSWATWTLQPDVVELQPKITSYHKVTSDGVMCTVYLFLNPLFAYILLQKNEMIANPVETCPKNTPTLSRWPRTPRFLPSHLALLTGGTFCWAPTIETFWVVCVVYELQGKRSHIPDIPFLKVAGSQWFFCFQRWDMSVSFQQGMKTTGDFEWPILVASQDIETQ